MRDAGDEVDIEGAEDGDAWGLGGHCGDWVGRYVVVLELRRLLLVKGLWLIGEIVGRFVCRY